MAVNVLEILEKSCFMRVSLSGVGMFEKKIKSPLRKKTSYRLSCPEVGHPTPPPPSPPPVPPPARSL